MMKREREKIYKHTHADSFKEKNARFEREDEKEIKRRARKEFL